MTVPGSGGTVGSLPSPGGGGEEEEEGMGAMGYQQTLMYGRYSRSLGDEIKEEAKRQQLVEKRRRKEYRKRKKELR